MFVKTGFCYDRSPTGSTSLSSQNREVVLGPELTSTKTLPNTIVKHSLVLLESYFELPQRWWGRRVQYIAVSAASWSWLVTRSRDVSKWSVRLWLLPTSINILQPHMQTRPQLLTIHPPHPQSYINNKNHTSTKVSAGSKPWFNSKTILYIPLLWTGNKKLISFFN